MLRDPRNLFTRLVASTATMSLVLGLAVGLAGGKQALAQVTALPPGTTTGIPVPVVATGTPPFGGILLQEVQSTLFGTNGPNTISGTVTSSVFRNGGGTLDFFYQFAFDGNTNIVVNQISISSFAGVTGVGVGQTGEDIDGPGGLAAQDLGGTLQNFYTLASPTGDFLLASRPSLDGDSISAGLRTGVSGNQTTFTFIVRTDVTDYTLAGSASVQGGGISAFNVSQGTIAPVTGSSTAAPEPGTLSLLALGMTIVPVVCAIRRRRSS